MKAAAASVVAFLAVTAAAASDEPTLDVTVDPRIELLAAVQLVSGYDDRTHLITRHDFGYKSRMLRQFNAYADHPAVRRFAEMSRGGFAFDAPPSVMLHYTDPPELAPVVPVPDDVAARAGGRERLDEWIGLLRDFAEETMFTDFFEQHASFHEAIIDDTRELLAGVDVALLEDYFGTRQHAYTIILAPLFHPGGFGPRVARADGTYDIFSVTGPQGMHPDGDRPTFGTAEDFRYLVWHEFSHSFANPVVDSVGEAVDRFAELFEPIRDPMRRQAYGSWRTCVYEHVVRAVTCRFATLELGEDEGRDALEYERGRSFIYIDGLVEALERYEAGRDHYPTFADFAPELVKVFEACANGPSVP